MKILYIFYAIILFSACSTENEKMTEQNWQYRGNAALSGYTDMKLPDKPVLLWTFESKSRTASSPVIYRNTAYWCDKRGKIYGVDISGNQVFEYDFATAVESTPMILDSVLYTGKIDGILSAVSLANKDTVWNYETEGQIIASPNAFAHDGKTALFVGSYDNYLYCINSENGKKINRYASGYYINGTVALQNRYAIFGGCDSWMRIIDCMSGAATDSLLLDAYIPASPAIDGDYCYIADYLGNVYEAVIKDGKIMEHRKMTSSSDDNSSFVSVPAVSKNLLYVLSNDRYLRAINRKDGSIEWKYLMKGNTGESSPVVCRNRTIVCTKTGIASILDAETGELLWEFDAGEQIVASPAVIKNHFYILTAKGTLFCFGKQI